MEEQNWSLGVSGDTSFSPERTSGLNPPPGNQRSIKNLAPSMKNTTSVRETSLQISDFIINNNPKPGEESDAATMRTLNTKTDTTQKGRAPDPAKPKFIRKVSIGANKLGEALNAEKRRTQNAATAETLKRNAPDPPKTRKTKPNWRNTEPERQNEGYKYKDSDNLMAISQSLPRKKVRNHPGDLRQTLIAKKRALSICLQPCPQSTDNNYLERQNLNNIQQPGKVSDFATMRTQNTNIATTQKRRASDPPKPESKRKVFVVAVKRTKNAEIAETPKRNPPDPLKTEPNLREEPENEEGLNRAKTKLDALADKTLSESFVVKQPGLRKYFASGQGDRLVKSVEKDYSCAIHVENQDNMRTLSTEAAMKSDASSGYCDDDNSKGGRGEEKMEDAVGSTDSPVLVTRNGKKISWKPGNIETEQAHILVSSQGACSQAIIHAGGPAMKEALVPLNTGDITATPGFALACSHVIHTSCSQWHGGKGEQVLRDIVRKCLQKSEELRGTSIAFPVIGTGNLNFPPDASSRIMLEEAISFCQAHPLCAINDIRFVVFQQDRALITAFAQEMANLQLKHKILPAYTMDSSRPGVFKRGVALPHFSKEMHLCVEVINGDLTQEKTDAIMNIISTEMNMNNAGELSKAILKAGGPQIQQELSQQGKQTAGTAVMTGGGRLGVRHVIHIIPGFLDKQHLQTCLETGLRLADTKNLYSISIPSVGTGVYGLAAADSAQVTFQALNSFSGRCQNVRKVRVVVYQAHMMPDFLQERNRQAVQDANKQDSDSAYDHSLKIYVTGKNKASVGEAVEALKKGFFEACTTQKVENETVSKLSHKQIDTLRRRAKDRDVKLEIEGDRIGVWGEATEVTGMVGEIWNEINERNKEIQEEEQAMLVSKNIEWSYEIHGQKIVFVQKTNAKIEMAHIKEQPAVQVTLRGDEFVIDLKAKAGRGRWNGETITISRKIKGAEDGIPLPNHWAPMPPSEKTVFTVPLLPGSSEYQDVLRKMQATTGGMNVQKIERVQNPHLYQSYMVRKQKIDKDHGGNSERQLFHGTDGKNINHINAQGFNRSFCGAHGTNYGRGVYFARDASYSVNYAGSRVGARHMYLARVIVGTYCVGTPNMIVPPSKDSSRPEILHDSVVNQMENPSIFVVFSDNQCYPEYLITF